MQTRHGGLARLAVLLAGIVLSLSGCISVDVRLTLDSQALATGTYRIEMTKQVATLAGITSAQSLEDAMSNDQDSPLPKGSSVEVKETDSAYAITVSIKDAPLTDDEMMAEVLPDGRIKFSFRQEGAPDSSSSDLGIPVGSVKFEVRFPGKVVEASPEFSKVGNNAVSLSTTLDKSFDLYAIGEAHGSGSSSSFPTVPIVIAAVLLLAIGIGLVRNRGSAATVTQVDITDHTDQVSRLQPGE